MISKPTNQLIESKTNKLNNTKADFLYLETIIRTKNIIATLIIIILEKTYCLDRGCCSLLMVDLLCNNKVAERLSKQAASTDTQANSFI